MKFTIVLDKLNKQQVRLLTPLLEKGKLGIYYLSYKNLKKAKSLIGPTALFNAAKFVCHVEEVRMEHDSFVIDYVIGWGDCSQITLSEEKAISLLAMSKTSNIVEWLNPGWLMIDGPEGEVEMTTKDYYDTMTDEENKGLLTALAVTSPLSIWKSLGWTKENLKNFAV